MRIVSHPILCNYYVTYRCNASCSFCDIWEKPSPYIQPDQVFQNLLDLKKLGVKVIDFTGGEPLLHRNIGHFLKQAKELGFITTLTTNTLLYPKKAEELKGNIDMLHFSLDSIHREKHDASRGVACYDSLLESIKLALSLGERPDILFTVFPENIDEIKEVYETLCKPNGLVLILNPVFDYGDIAKDKKLSSDQLNTLRNWGKQKKIYLNDAFIQLRIDGGNQVHDPVCRAASTTVVISPENKLILPCYHLGTKEFPIENKLFERWKSQEVQDQILLEGKLPGCQGCTINCYMQPSFAVEINRYFFKALPSTLKYNYWKGTWKELF
ncbi:MAG: radical SAM protein [Cytophagaceae bacterium]|nr:radical SAM protein [Cytophagaceae bacterium]